MIRILTSPHSEARLVAARKFISGFPPGTEILLVGATRDAADDLARGMARTSGALFGVHRFSLTQCAALYSASETARSRLAPLSRTAAQALASRAVFRALAADPEAPFRDSARFPGFARAVESTLSELRMAGVDPGRMAEVEADRFVAPLLREYEQALADARLVDRADLFRIAARGVAEAPEGSPGRGPLVLLDVPVSTNAEAEFVTALARASPEVLALVPDGDRGVPRALAAAGDVSVLEAGPADDSALMRLRRNLFALDVADGGGLDDSVSLYSAPGEGRECVEIARRVLEESRRGVPFDEMAVLVRNPYLYWGHIEHVFHRAGVPFHFSRGTRRPDPAGRAFLLLLSTACDGLSAVRFSEYLSLGQVPLEEGGGEVVPWRPPDDETLLPVRPDPDPDPVADTATRSIPAPWKWERLIVESSVIGGADRWRRRLEGLGAEIDLRIAAIRRLDPDRPDIDRLLREREQLDHLTRFALPMIEELAALPGSAPWRDWLPALRALASRGVSHPERIHELLAELEPMGDVGPVTLGEVIEVLSDRLTTLDQKPPPSRFGRVFIGTPEQARGRSFRVVFVPGLAEKIFPRRPHEDPLLLDTLRRSVDPALPVQDDRAHDERMRLKLAVGAAVDRVHLSYSRFQMSDARPRVPSFYALDLVRAVTGEVPDYEALEREAAGAGGAWLAWPAPADPARAIDDFEHDLAVLKPLLTGRPGPATGGRARYLFELNDVLKDALTARWRRWQMTAWTPYDGLIRPGLDNLENLHDRRPVRKPYSVSMLQKFAVCPYQFLLASIYRFEPLEAPESIERMDPLTRGSLFHEVQRDVLRDLKAAGTLPLHERDLPGAYASVDRHLDRIADTYRDRLAPAIDRVWRDDVTNLRVDLKAWLRDVAQGEHDWTPRHFEFGFGLTPDDDHDPASVADPVMLEGGYLLRGAIDLVEEGEDGSLRVTDHKTGRNWTPSGLEIGGGEALQPVLYGLVAEQALGRTVREARLYFCTQRGNFSDRTVILGADQKEAGLDALAIVDRAVAAGILPAAPKEGACDYCDFRPVCGPGEEARSRRKPRDLLKDLERLREMP